MTYKLYTADILEWAKTYDGPKFHACLCDPPYHLTSIVKRFGKPNSAPAQFGTDGAFARHSGGFMGQVWDGGDVAFRPETWVAIADCLLPGAYLLAFGGTRTWHRLAVAIEDAGFEIRDTVMWVYGSGFPKSHDVSKAIDRDAGVRREVIGKRSDGRYAYGFTEQAKRAMGDIVHAESQGFTGEMGLITSPATDLAKTWNGYGSALKPAWEPIIVARKPLEGTIAQNCVEYGSGAINIDGCRVPSESVPINKLEEWSGFGQKERPDYVQEINNKGRWPANLIHDGSDEVLDGFPHSTSGAMKKPYKYINNGFSLGAPAGNTRTICEASEGSASRFFYCAKASKSERDAGCEYMEETNQDHNRFDKCARCGGYILQNPDRPSACKCEEPERVHATARNFHPTVKPIALTEYLAKLILPPSEYAPRRLLVPFSGAASEMIGAHRAGWDEIVGIEMIEKYTKIAEARLKYWTNIPRQMELK